MSEDYKALYEQTERGYRTLAEQLVERDLAEVAAREEAEKQKQKPADPSTAQRVYNDLLKEEWWVEASRAQAWIESGLRYKNGPSDGSWPPGVDREAYMRKACGLNADGTALLSEAPPPEQELSSDTSFHKLLRQKHRM